MSRDQITVGVALRVIAPRWDRPVGTIARVTETGTLLVGGTWWFAVEWLTYLPKRGPYSLRLFEEDLPSFELVTGPMVIPLPATRRQQQHERSPLPVQTTLPFTQADENE